jgi:diacylglycerol kinase family enzyme
MPKLGVIVNPHARKNRNAFDRVARLRDVVGELGCIEETDTPEDVVPAVGRMLDAGVEHFVADGGDGALHVLLNGLRTVCPSGPLPSVTPTNGGTIDFVARKMGIRTSVEETVAALTAAIARRITPPLVSIDSLRVTGTRVREDGGTEPFSRIGFATAAGGVGQRFFDEYYEEPVLGSPAIVHIVARAVGSYFRERLPFARSRSADSFASRIFRPTEARVTIDAEVLPDRWHGAIHAGAFDLQLGGALRVFPLARTDGVLHFQAGSLSPVEMMKNLPNVATGRLLAAASFRERAGRTMTIEVGPRIDVALPRATEE